jgi:hypothetical protein
LIPKCLPEGGRYKMVPILSSHAHSLRLLGSLCTFSPLLPRWATVFRPSRTCFTIEFVNTIRRVMRLCLFGAALRMEV